MSRQTVLWTQSHGGKEVQFGKIFHVDRLYPDPEGVDCTVFQVLDMPVALGLPLPQQQWQGDASLKKQQKLLGMTACALS